MLVSEDTAMVSLRTITEDCLDEDGTISVREDVLGVLGDDHPQDRSLLEQVDRIQNDPFVRVAVVTIRPPGATAGQYAHLQRDLDNANTVFQNECGTWVYPVGSRVVTTDLLGKERMLDQNDCRWTHYPSREEEQLFDLGRDMGANLVCYCIGGSVLGGEGCASHPRGQPGFWIDPDPGEWTFAHELGHLLGDNTHVRNKSNLMYAGKSVQNPPPNLNSNQCNQVRKDDLMEHC